MKIDEAYQMHWGDKLDDLAILFMPIFFGLFNMVFWMMSIEERDKTQRK
jgi:hypothetical protein